MNINYEYAGLAVPIGKKLTLGSDKHYLYVNDIAGYDNYGNKGHKLSAYDSMLTLGNRYALHQKGSKFLSIGSTVKIIQQKLVDERAQSIAADLGALCKFYKKRAGIAAVIKNIGISKPTFISESAPLPLEYRIGGAFDFPFKKMVLTVTGDVSKPYKETSYAALGAELTAWKLAALRAGHRSARNEGSGFSAGGGLKFNTVNVDYGCLSNYPMHDLQTLSATARYHSTRIKHQPSLLRSFLYATPLFLCPK